jgi:simple sugar transport system permease protein
MDIDLIGNILHLTLRAGTPLLIVALGELICQRSGVLNLGQEGMMLMGAVTGFVIAYETGNSSLGFIAAIMAGVMMSLLFGFVVLHLQGNQVASGLALTILGVGLSAFIGMQYVGDSVGVATWNFFGLSDIPLLGDILFSHDIFVYLSVLAVCALFFLLKHTRAGLLLRAVGESPQSAHAMGIGVIKIRYLAVAFGGAMAGLAGAYLSLVITPMWAENMTAGRGWIALALVVFASWRVERVLLGAYLFGFMGVMNMALQGLGVPTSPNLLAIMPYAATILVLVWLSRDQRKMKLHVPVSLAKPFHPDHQQ